MPGTTSKPQFNRWYDANYERESFDSDAEYEDHRKLAFTAYRRGQQDAGVQAFGKKLFLFQKG